MGEPPSQALKLRGRRNAMNRWKAVLLVCVAMLLGLSWMPVPAHADPRAFGIDNVGDLYTINLATAKATLIGRTTMEGRPGGLALSPTGMLFATDWKFKSYRNKLYRIDPATAATTVVGETGRTLIFALDFNGTTLFGSQFKLNPRISSINTATGEATSIVNLSGAPDLRIDALTTLLPTTMLMMTRRTGAHNVLQSVDLTTGVTGGTINTGGGTAIGAMDFASDGNLYGVDFEGGVWHINPTTGARTVIGNTGKHYWFGLAAIPAESP